MIDYTMCKYRYYLIREDVNRADDFIQLLDRIITRSFNYEYDPTVIIHSDEGCFWLYTVQPLPECYINLMRSTTAGIFDLTYMEEI